eukprot:gene9880-biopygen206
MSIAEKYTVGERIMLMSLNLLNPRSGVMLYTDMALLRIRTGVRCYWGTHLWLDIIFIDWTSDMGLVLSLE